MDDSYLTQAEVAAMLRLSIRTVQELRKRGLLECVYVTPRRVRFTRGAVETFIANHNQR